MEKKKIVVVGNGMTSYKFCEKLYDGGFLNQFDVEVYGEEPVPAYDRVHLTDYYTGTPVDELLMASKEWYASKGIVLHVGQLVTDVNTKAKTIQTHTGVESAFDSLVFATGSGAFVPPVPGVEKDGVFVYRTLEDLDNIKAYVPKSKKAAVIGGGLLGLEAAKAVMDEGIPTTVIEFADRLMPRQLDPQGGEVLKETLEGLGLEVLANKNTKNIDGNGKIEGMSFADGTSLDVDLLVISAGIKPRDEVAGKAGLEVGARGGIVVNSKMETSAKDVYAIGECALSHNMIWGLVAPCYDMAEACVSTLTGGETTFEGADLSTKLKLIGTDVASFGDALGSAEDCKTVRYENKALGIYKRINISSDGKELLGGVLVGEADDYNMLLQMVNNKMALPPNPEDLILGARGGEAAVQMNVLDLPDEAMVCSCEGVTKGTICSSIAAKDMTASAEIKAETKAGAGCGGCMPMVNDILDASLKASGKEVKKVICEHFDYTRQELLDLIKLGEIKTYSALIKKHGKGSGCEICKPLAASLLASSWNELITKQAVIQDTNDRFLANIQRGGTYSVVPRIPGGEITPDKLIAIGEVAKKYDLYTKITGGQRIDLFGARVHELPNIWEELIDAGFESGHAYGKSLRTVKSCVGSTWCRYGQQESVSFAIEVEERYKGIRSPHKLKGGVSGCVRECAEAKGKDFGIIATEKGWNLYVCGNGGAEPKHAQLLATDVDNATCLKYLDRFLMFYIRTAAPLTRTSKWLDGLEGGIDHLIDVVVNDSLNVGEELDNEMQLLVDTFHCEWKEVVNNPELRKRFTHFVNSEKSDDSVDFVELRDQKMPKKWS